MSPPVSNPSPVADRGANARPGEAAERCANTSTGATLDDGYASGTTADGFPRVKKCAAEPAAAAEGVARAGASTAARGGFGAGTDRALSFAAVETASGLAHLPDLSPPA